MSFVRNVSFQVKPGNTAEFNKLLAKDVLPLMKKQAGFRHELAMLNGNHAVAVSVWSDRASADKYAASAYPEILKKLTPIIEGAPQVSNYELAATTLAV